MRNNASDIIKTQTRLVRVIICWISRAQIDQKIYLPPTILEKCLIDFFDIESAYGADAQPQQLGCRDQERYLQAAISHDSFLGQGRIACRDLTCSGVDWKLDRYLVVEGSLSGAKIFDPTINSVASVCR